MLQDWTVRFPFHGSMERGSHSTICNQLKKSLLSLRRSSRPKDGPSCHDFLNNADSLAIQVIEVLEIRSWLPTSKLSLVIRLEFLSKAKSAIGYVCIGRKTVTMPDPPGTPAGTLAPADCHFSLISA